MASKPTDGAIHLCDTAAEQRRLSAPVSLVTRPRTSKGISRMTRPLDSPHRANVSRAFVLPRTAQRPICYDAPSAQEGGMRSQTPEGCSL